MRTDIPDTAEDMLAEIEKRQQDTGAGVSEEAAKIANIVDGVVDAQRRLEIVELVQFLSEQTRRGTGQMSPSIIPGDEAKRRFANLVNGAADIQQEGEAKKRRRTKS